MVFSLALDVTPDYVHMNGADTELAVSVLPCEIRIPTIQGLYPGGGGGLDLFHDLGRRVILGLGKEDVDVITNRVDLNQRGVVVAEDASDVSVELIALDVAEQGTTVLGAKDEVDEDVGE
jgi:hypothetical protein